MEKAKHSVVFEAEVDGGGRVHFSRQVAEQLGVKSGAKVTVRIVGGVLSRELTARNVSDEEIERIGNVQFEDRDQVVKFLSCEGILGGDPAFRKRVRRFRS
jgi:hypothetical protein